VISRALSSVVRGTALVCCSASIVSCSRDAAARHYLAGADTLLSQRKYPEVIQQSRRALDADHDDSHAAALLGIAHLELAHFGQAYQFLLQARNRAPRDGKVRVALARLYVDQGRLDDAREQAFAAASDTTDVEARILRVITARTPEQADSLAGLLAHARLDRSSEMRRSLAFAIASLRKQDTATAGRLLREAVANNPKSPESHAALASFYALVGQGSRADAERAIVAGMAPPNSTRRLELANYFLALGQRSEAKQWLVDMTTTDSVGLTAHRLMAELRLADNESDAVQSIAAVLERDSTDVEALLQRGRARLASHDVVGALADFQRVVRSSPEISAAHYQLALAELARLDSTQGLRPGDSPVARARSELETAVKLAGTYPDASLKLAELRIRVGEARSTIADLDRFVSDNPRSIRGLELLAAALAASGRDDEANETFGQLIDIDRDRAESHYEFGVSLQTRGKLPEATREFEAALALAPAYADPMTQIVLIDVMNGKSGAALDRLNQQLAKAPRSAPLYDLVGLVHAARQEVTEAESAYRRAVQLDPGLVDAHVRLADLYNATGRFDLAIAQADSATRVDPRNVRALMALGVGHQQRGDTAQAREAYETVLSLNPKFAGAANNLAYLFADQPGQEAAAYKFASIARDNAPDDPHIGDTFGWVLYKRGDYAHAMTVLTNSAARLPDSPNVQYHLGMVAQKLGQTAAARAALTKAVSSPQNFPGKDEARRILAQLK